METAFFLNTHITYSSLCLIELWFLVNYLALFNGMVEGWWFFITLLVFAISNSRRPDAPIPP
jgi:hypothetical protein